MRVKRFALVGLVAILLSGCGSESDNSSATTSAGSSSDASASAQAEAQGQASASAKAKADADAAAAKKKEEEAAKKKAADEAAKKKAAEAAALKPKTYAGAGDDVLKIAKHGTGAEAVAITHAGASNFVVETLDASLKTTGLLVNTIGNYSGTVLMDKPGFQDLDTKTLKITADGAWTVKIMDLKTIASFDGSKPITGAGDDVFNYTGDPTSATFTHSGSRNIAVTGYGGDFPDLLVNEIGAYNGKLVWRPGLYEITADGAWSVKF